MIRYFLYCLVVLCTSLHVVTPYSPFRFRFRAFPDSASATTSNLMSPSSPFRFHKRSYQDLHCRGMYDPSMFAKLAGVCDDCYNLMRAPEVHGMCRRDCFSTETFQQCLQTLLLEKDSQIYMEMVQIIGKKKR